MRRRDHGAAGHSATNVAPEEEIAAILQKQIEKDAEISSTSYRRVQQARAVACGASSPTTASSVRPAARSWDLAQAARSPGYAAGPPGPPIIGPPEVTEPEANEPAAAAPATSEPAATSERAATSASNDDPDAAATSDPDAAATNPGVAATNPSVAAAAATTMAAATAMAATATTASAAG